MGLAYVAIPSYMLLAIPYWFVALLAAALASWLLRRWRTAVRRRRTNACPTCGYDLRATPDRCPECGTKPQPAAGAIA